MNDRQLLMIERDNHGDDVTRPAVQEGLPSRPVTGCGERRVRREDAPRRPSRDSRPDGVGGDGDFFRLPFYTIESVHVVDRQTLLVASDNNFPFSNGRSRSRSPDRRGPLAADDTEMILVRLGTPLDADPRLFPAAVK